MNAKLAALKKKLTGMGNEPHFTAINSDPMGAIHALNYYSANHTINESKEWSLKWLSDVDPSLATLLSPVKDTYFLNRGFVCRMVERGYVLSDTQYRDHVGFYVNLLNEKGLKPKEAKAQIKKTVSINPNMLALDNMIEDAKAGIKIPKQITLDLNKANLDEVRFFCERNLNEMVEEREQYTPEMIRLMRPIYTNALASVNKVLASGKANDVVKTTRKPRTPKKTASVKTSKVTAVTVVKDSATGVQGIQPKDVIGKKVMYLLDPKYKKIRIYHAESGKTLDFKGKKLINYDLTLSKDVAFKSLDAFFEIAGRRNFTADRIEKGIDKTGAKHSEISTGLLRDVQTILAAE